MKINMETGNRHIRTDVGLNKHRVTTFAASIAAAAMLGLSNIAFAVGPVPAELRSWVGILPQPIPAGDFAPSAPSGGVQVGARLWSCDARLGFAQIVPTDASADPIYAISSDSAIHLPLAAGFGNATGGQIVYDGSGFVYVSQGVIANNTPSNVQGILRIPVDPSTGLTTGNATVIAANSGLGGNQPTALALGPDGNLYFGNLKNGDIKRILNPGAGTTQVVQSMGKTVSGHTVRAMAFLGSDLYVGTDSEISRIAGATSTSCTGGCAAAALNDGFPNVPHVGVVSDGTAIYYSVAGTVNQVWKVMSVLANFSPTLTFQEIATGGVDRNGNNQGNFSFVGAKSNMLFFDSAGNLWIGDDTNNGTSSGTGAIWTVNAAQLATVGGGTPPVDPAITAEIRDSWFVTIGNKTLTANFVPSSPGATTGTYTGSILDNVHGGLTLTSGTYVISAVRNPQVVANPQGHLALTDSATGQLIDGDILILRADWFIMNGTDTFEPSLPTFFEASWFKQTI